MADIPTLEYLAVTQGITVYDRHPITGKPLALTSEELGVDDSWVAECCECQPWVTSDPFQIEGSDAPHVIVTLDGWTTDELQHAEARDDWYDDYEGDGAAGQLTIALEESYVYVETHAVPDDVCADEEAARLLEDNKRLTEERDLWKAQAQAVSR